MFLRNLINQYEKNIRRVIAIGVKEINNMFGSNGYGTTEYGASGINKIYVIVTLTLKRTVKSYVSATLTLKRTIREYVSNSLTLKRTIREYILATLTLLRRIRVWMNRTKPEVMTLSNRTKPAVMTLSERTKPTTNWTNRTKPQ